uniref:Putative secreted protein n=1 Tax=Anopheles darlingi TaxID=43151 RepID=A0A2M4DFT9_ANODA
MRGLVRLAGRGGTILVRVVCVSHSLHPCAALCCALLSHPSRICTALLSTGLVVPRCLRDRPCGLVVWLKVRCVGMNEHDAIATTVARCLAPRARKEHTSKRERQNDTQKDREKE